MIDRTTARLLTALALAGTTMLSVAACSDSGSPARSAGSPGDTSPSVLSIRDTDTVGEVFADTSGHTVYTADEEADGKIVCTSQCLQFWHPVLLNSSDASQQPGGSEHFGMVTRPDNGKVQVTYQNKPVYTFTEDKKPGDTKGDGFKDSFAGRNFTWHAVVRNPSDATSSKPSQGSSNSGGYGY